MSAAKVIQNCGTQMWKWMKSPLTIYFSQVPVVTNVCFKQTS